MIKSPLRYPGGKSRAIKYLKQFIPDFKEYREPMLGGGSMMFYVMQNFEIKSCKISDLNYDLFCFWKNLKESPDELVCAVQKIFDGYTDGRKLYTEILARRNNKLSNFQRAIDFFILNRITFSGVADSGGYSNESFHKRFTQSSIQRLREASSLLGKISVCHSEYSELLRSNGKDVFIFLDPPYYSASKSRLYGKNGHLHTQFNHEDFFMSVSKCKHKWLITYDNCAFIKDLFKEFYQIDWELQYGMNNYKQSNAAKGKELLIANYDINKIQREGFSGQN